MKTFIAIALLFTSGIVFAHDAEFDSPLSTTTRLTVTLVDTLPPQSRTDQPSQVLAFNFQYYEWHYRKTAGLLLVVERSTGRMMRFPFASILSMVEENWPPVQ